MADETRDIIIEIDVDAKDFNQEIGKVNENIRDNRKEIKELSKDYDLNAKEIAELEQENKKLSASKRELSKESDIQSNSLNALRNELSKQVKERNNLNTSTTEGATRFKELQTSIKGLNDQISGFEEAGGDFRRNVGNYPKLLSEAAGGITVFGTSLSDIFSLIARNPFLILVGAITSLIAIFKKSQTGMEFFRVAGAAMNTVFAKMSDLVEALGVSIIEAFSKPKETFDDLVKTIKDGIFKYFTEFIPNAIEKVVEGFGLLAKAAQQLFAGDFSEALETATEATVLLVDGITDLNPVTAAMKAGFESALPVLKEWTAEVLVASEAAGVLETRMIANEKAQADLAVTTAEQLLTLKDLTKTIEDQTIATELRLAAAIEAEEIEIALTNERLRLKKEEIDILLAQNELANSTEEDLQRVRDAEIEYFNLKAESIERETTLQAKKNGIVNQQLAKEKAQRDKDKSRIKKEDKDKKKREEAELKRDEAIAKIKTKLKEDVLKTAIKLLGEGTAAGKAAALIQIANDSARGVSGAIAAGAEVGPFPANLAAIATGVGAVLSGIANAYNLLSGGGGASVGSISGIEASASSGVNSSLSTTAEQIAATKSTTVAAVQNLPPLFVSVTDINDGQSDRLEVVQESTLA